MGDLLHLVMAEILEVLEHASKISSIAEEGCRICVQKLQQSIQGCAGLLSCSRSQVGLQASQHFLSGMLLYQKVLRSALTVMSCSSLRKTSSDAL